VQKFASRTFSTFDQPQKTDFRSAALQALFEFGRMAAYHYAGLLYQTHFFGQTHLSVMSNISLIFHLLASHEIWNMQFYVFPGDNISVFVS
jgi:hypothetical protein